MNKVYRVGLLLLVVFAARLALPIVTLSGSVSHAQTVPFTAYTPPGWTWWRGEAGFVLLPADAKGGDQSRFFIVTSGSQATEWLPGWMGGGEIVWQGPVQAAGIEWNVQVTVGNDKHGLIGASPEWSFAAVSPESRWEQDAGIYNSILKGGAQ